MDEIKYYTNLEDFIIKQVYLISFLFILQKVADFGTMIEQVRIFLITFL